MQHGTYTATTATVNAPGVRQALAARKAEEKEGGTPQGARESQVEGGGHSSSLGLRHPCAEAVYM